MADIAKAIKAINPDAEFRYVSDNINSIEWFNGTPPISVEDLTAKKAELQAEEDALEYARVRETAYPELKEFAEAYTEKEIGGNSAKWDAYVLKYNQVRTDNPKP